MVKPIRTAGNVLRRGAVGCNGCDDRYDARFDLERDVLNAIQ
jgi:hypothetical protein